MILIFDLNGLKGAINYIDLVSELTIYIILLRKFIKKKNYELRLKNKVNFKIYFYIVFIWLGYTLTYDNTLGLAIDNIIGKDSWYFNAISDILKNPISAFIRIALIAPIFEEIFLRGIILEQLSKKNKAVKAIIVSSVLFGIMHFNITQGINAFFIGIILGTVYIKTRSLVPCIFLHFVNNFLSFIGSYITTNNVQKFNVIELIVGVVVLPLGCYLFMRGTKKGNTIESSTSVA